MTFKRVFRYDPQNRLLRLFRLVWDGRQMTQGGWPVSHKLTVGLTHPFRWPFRRELDGWILNVFGVRVHHRVSHGGRFV